MITEEDRIELERRIAELLGWTQISSVGEALFGVTPRHVAFPSPNYDVYQIHQWCRDPAASFELMVKYEIGPKPQEEFTTASYDDNFVVEELSEHRSNELMVMYAIARAVERKLLAKL